MSGSRGWHTDRSAPAELTEKKAALIAGRDSAFERIEYSAIGNEAIISARSNGGRCCSSPSEPDGRFVA